MAVLDVADLSAAVAPVPTHDARPSIAAAGPRFSSPAAQVPDADEPSAHTARLAVELGTSERALRTAEGMIRRHLRSAGQRTAGPLMAMVEGVRRTQLTAVGLVIGADEYRDGFAVALIADPLVMLVVASPEEALHWTLLPGGPSVTARADGLRLIRCLATGGELTLQLGSHEPCPPVVLDGGAWQDEDEWRLFEDLAVVEEWSGVTIPVPTAVSAEDATLAAQAASWARTQRVDARIDGVITFGARDELETQTIDELRIHQDFDVNLMGTWISFGEGAARVALDRVERASAGEVTYRAFPAQSDVSFSLSPPATRRLPPRRTQARHEPPSTFAPDGRPPTNLAFARPARRRVSDVLAAMRINVLPTTAQPGGTAGLLDQIRGE